MEGLILMLKLQYFGHLMRRADSLEKIRCLERLSTKGEGGSRGWDGWMASPTQWIWVWANFGRQRRTGKPGVLQFMELQRVGYDLVTEQHSNKDEIILDFLGGPKTWWQVSLEETGKGKAEKWAKKWPGSETGQDLVKEGQEPPPAGSCKEQILPRACRKLVALPTPWFWASGVQSCERLNFCCFKPPSLWYFVTAAVGNQSRWGLRICLYHSNWYRSC